MINIRYHIITLVAVFLALAVGIVAGSTVIQQSLVNNLEENLNRLEKTNTDVAKRNDELGSEVGRLRSELKALSDQGPAQLLRNRLNGTTVLVLGVDGIDEGPVTSLRNTMEAAGADVAGPIWLRERLALTDEQSITELRDILGVTTRDPGALQAELVRQLGDLLAVVAAPVGLAVPGVTTTLASAKAVNPQEAATALLVLLEELRQAGFVDLDGGLANLAPSDLVGARLVVTGGPGAKLDDDALIYPLLERIGQGDAPLAVVVEAADDDPATPSGAFVGVLRGDRRLRDRLSTVDDGEGFAGWAATVLALDDLDRGRVGHYGTAEGAERLLPAPATP